MDLTKKCARCGFALGHHSAGNESFCPEKVKGECRFSKNKFEPRGEKGRHRGFFARRLITSFFYLPILMVRNIAMSLTNRDLVTEAYTANQVRKFRDGY